MNDRSHHLCDFSGRWSVPLAITAASNDWLKGVLTSHPHRSICHWGCRYRVQVYAFYCSQTSHIYMSLSSVEYSAKWLGCIVCIILRLIDVCTRMTSPDTNCLLRINRHHELRGSIANIDVINITGVHIVWPQGALVIIETVQEPPHDFWTCYASFKTDFTYKVSRLHLCKMRVPKCYVENKALFEARK